MNRQVGISPKAILAAVIPALGGFVAVIVQWIATGSFDRSEFATAVGAVIAAGLAFLGAYAAGPGEVERTVPVYREGDSGLMLVEVLVVLLIVVVVVLLLGAAGVIR